MLHAPGEINDYRLPVRCFGVSISGLSSRPLAFELLRQFTFEPPLFSGFQKKRVLLHVPDNAFLLDLSLETAKGALNGFAVENSDFCQNVPPWGLRSCREYECVACRKQRIFSQMSARSSSFTRQEQLIRFLLKLLNRDLSTGVGLQLCVELIVLLHAGFTGRACRDTGTEFLKVDTYPVEGEAASAVGTFNSCQCWAFLREVMNSRTSSIEENTLSLLRELQG